MDSEAVERVRKRSEADSYSDVWQCPRTATPRAFAEAALAEVTSGFGGEPGAYRTYMDPVQVAIIIHWAVDWRLYTGRVCYETAALPGFARVVRDIACGWAREAEAIRKRRVLNFWPTPDAGGGEVSDEGPDIEGMLDEAESIDEDADDITRTSHHLHGHKRVEAQQEAKRLRKLARSIRHEANGLRQERWDRTFVYQAARILSRAQFETIKAAADVHNRGTPTPPTPEDGGAR